MILKELIDKLSLYELHMGEETLVYIREDQERYRDLVEDDISATEHAVYIE